MKKVVILIFSLVLILLIAGCGHKHTMQEKIVLKVSCDTDGQVEHYCSECDYKYSEQIKAHGHNYGKESVLLEATCTDVGKKESVCSICGDKKEEIIEPNHKFDEVIVSEASCRKSGEKKLTCSVCGYQENQEIEASGHLFISNKCTECNAYKVTDLESDVWYNYNELNILSVQNAFITTATPAGKGAIVGYYPICQNCRITGLFGLAGPEINYPITKTYICDDCGERTYVKFKIEY